MVFLLWNWISGICRQKRILVLLCAFGSSFIFLNYSLLSSSSISSSTTTASHRSQDLFSSVNDELDAINIGISGQEKYEELANRKLQSSHKRIMLISSKKHTENGSERGKNAQKFVLTSPVKAKPKLQPNGETNDLPAFGQSNSSARENKSGVIFISAAAKQAPKRVNKIVKDDSHDATSNSRNVNYVNTDKKTDDGNPSMGATLSSPISPLFLEESIIIGSNRLNLVNNNLSDIFSVPLSSSSSSSLSPPPIILNRRTSLLPENVLKKPPQPSPPPSSANMTLKLSKHYNNEDNYVTTLSNAQVAESTSPASTITGNFSTSPFHIPSCNSPSQLRRVQKRKKNLTVIENFIMGWKRVKCNETITYTTHGDYRYLDNLVPLVERWDGPVSLSIYAPGTDLEKTLGIISYLKMCTSSKVNEWVTFHLIYDVRHSTIPTQSNGKPGDILWLDALYQSGKWRDCSGKPNFNKYDHTFRVENGLLYPINIARNIARAAAKTYFVLASDIELYPSINLIPSFMKMLKRLQMKKSRKTVMKTAITTAAESLVSKLLSTSMSSIIRINDIKNETITKDQKENPQFHMQYQGQRQELSNYPYHNRHVFVLPVFEVKKDVLPCQVETKEQLLTIMKKRAAVIFHHSICPQCHTFPKFEEWKVGVPSEAKKELDGCDGNATLNTIKGTIHPMNIFHKAKRKFPHQLWEPIFIGTKDEPIYDERLSWEGLRDKMVSGYVMCALNYDFYILDNAFLVHKPGIRKVVHLVTKTVMNQDRLINNKIRSELLRKFGKHEECAL